MTAHLNEAVYQHRLPSVALGFSLHPSCLLILPLSPGGRFRCWWPEVCIPASGVARGLADPVALRSRSLSPPSPSLRAAHHHCAFTNIEAEAKAVISTAIHPCHFRQSIRFDVGPPFVGQEPLTRSTEELLCWWPVLISGLSYLTVCLSTVSKLSWWSRFAHQPAHAPTSRKAICRT